MQVLRTTRNEVAGYRITRRIDHRMKGTFLNRAVLAESESE